MMRIISKKALFLFREKHQDSNNSLNDWYTKINKGNYNSLHQLRKTFPSADAVGRYTIFNIGGNKYRLITAIHYNTRTVYIRDFWTHSEYSQKLRQKDLIIGNL